MSFNVKFGNLFLQAHSNISVLIENVLVMQTDSCIRINCANNNESRIIKTQHKIIIIVTFINKKIGQPNW